MVFPTQTGPGARGQNCYTTEENRPLSTKKCSGALFNYDPGRTLGMLAQNQALLGTAAMTGDMLTSFTDLEITMTYYRTSTHASLWPACLQ